MAAVLACGPGAVLSHGSALTLWGVWKRWDSPFDVTVTTDRRPKGVRVHRATRFDKRDIARHQGIPVTTLAKTLLDCAPRMTPKSLTRAINDGRLNGQLSIPALADVIARHPTHRGRRTVEAVLGAAGDKPTRSTFEDEFVVFCQRYGLPRPRMNAVVCGYEVDALFEEEKVIVELDGWAFHSSRASFESDRNKDADTLAAGFATLHITWARYQQSPDQEAARLHAILRSRRSAP
jgi:very-short-patch-repair endonuclease